jgi:adenylosuccinate synthase
VSEQAASLAQSTSTAVVGLQWGDEGKGKLVDVLAREHQAVVRFNGGANAGHSIVVGSERYAVHLVPVGVFIPGVRAVIGNGVVVDPEQLLKEITELSARGVDLSGLVISSRAHVVMPYHKLEDQVREELANEAGGRAIGTTRRGIGPAYADKAQRRGAIRMGDLLHPDRLKRRVEEACRLKRRFLGEVPETDAAVLMEQLTGYGRELGPRIADTTYLLHEMLDAGERLLFEGANATLLDVDHGTYPYATASNACALGISAGTGVPMAHVGTILGVAKAYSTRVGGGPMPTELEDAVGDGIRERGREYGTTTGRPRRVGWLDLVALRYATMINGVTHLAITLLDVLAGMDELKLCVGYRVGGVVMDRFLPDGPALAEVEPVYETMPGFSGDISGARTLDELPAGAQAYVDRISAFCGVPVGFISVGPDRSEIIAVDDRCGCGARA